MKKSRAQLSKKQILVRTALVITALALAVAALMIWKPLDSTQENETRASIDEGSARLERVTYDGKQYVENTDITTILLLGIDKGEDIVGGYRDGGQADFIMLVVLDGKNQTVSRLQIDRDTMTEVEVLSILGKSMGTRTWQIALSHSFGITAEECNAHTIKSVQYLMEGIKIDMCASLYMDGIAAFNDALGGVTVYIEDDFSNVTDSLPMGEYVTLRGKQAEYFTRSRMGVGSGTNDERMKKRQYAYMEAALDIMIANCKKDATFATSFINEMTASGCLVTDFTVGRLANEVNSAISYKILPITYLEGQHSLYTEGGNEYNRFDPDGEFIRRWVIQTYYTEV